MSKRKALTPTPRRAVGALVKEALALERVGFIVELDEADASRWQVSVEPSVLKSHGLSLLIGDLRVWASMVRKPVAIVLEVRFGQDNPHEPPFVRVVRPRFKLHTGHVTAGGSICTKLLTTDGWRPELSVEAVLRSILENFGDGQGRVDTVSTMRGADYTLAEASDAFKRVASDHGWSSRVTAL